MSCWESGGRDRLLLRDTVVVAVERRRGGVGELLLDGVVLATGG